MPWELLERNFAYRNCVLKRNDVCQRLPAILGGRLDLIEPGPCVKLVKSPDRLRLEGGVNAMGDFTVSLKRGANVVPLQSAQGALSSIRKEGWRFTITTHSSEGLPELSAQVRELLATSQAHAGSGVLTLTANTDNARRLRSFWTKAPESIEKRADLPLRGMLSERAAPVSFSLELREQSAFVELSANCRCGGQRLNFDDLKRVAAVNNPYLQTSGGNWLYLDKESAARAMTALMDEGLDGRPTLMLRDEAKSRVERLQTSMALNWEDRSVPLVQRLRKETFPPLPALPDGLEGVLRPYQKTGVRFLADCCRYGVGAILADDMGLGKTLQVLAMLDSFFMHSPRDFRAMVVCPASVIDTWVQQCRRFTPELPVAALRGTPEKRKAIVEDSRNRLLVTHYALVRADIGFLVNCHLQYVILDEAQAIKNPEAQTTAAVRALDTEHRLALTGTPLENRLSDLWSIMDFLNPGLCGDKVGFEVASSTANGLARLRRILSLVMLRRSKAMVAPELPPRTEETIRVEMSPDLRVLYDREMARAKGEAMAGGYPGVFAAITRMRRFCCAPELLLAGENIPASPKVDFLLERLADLLAGGHSVLVFSQFTSLLDLIARRLDTERIRHASITGETPLTKRSAIVEEFNGSGEPTVLLLSLKAAGTGLTLTRADYVFLFDPWWNPAAESQAIDRTHRIGQDKPVFAYRIIVQDSIEEKVLAIVQQKRELFSSVIDGAGADGDQPRLSLEELRSLL